MITAAAALSVRGSEDASIPKPRASSSERASAARRRAPRWVCMYMYMYSGNGPVRGPESGDTPIRSDGWLRGGGWHSAMRALRLHGGSPHGDRACTAIRRDDATGHRRDALVFLCHLPCRTPHAAPSWFCASGAAAIHGLWRSRWVHNVVRSPGRDGCSHRLARRRRRWRCKRAAGSTVANNQSLQSNRAC